MPPGQRTLRYLVDNYVCRVCRGNFKMSQDEETGRWGLVCAADPAHHGAWSKGYLEHREHLEHVEYIEIIYDRELRELWSWLPEREQMTAEEARDDLFGL